MSKSENIKVQILTPKSLYQAQEMINIIGEHIHLLPELLPEKYGWTEPLKYVFEPDKYMDLVTKPMASTVYWKRSGKYKADGSFNPRWKSGVSYLVDTHTSIDFTSHNIKTADMLIHYIRKMSIFSGADYSYIDVNTEQYRSYGIKRGSIVYGDFFYITSHRLRHWLPDMMWGTVFGPAYVRLFGKERVMSTPAFLVEELADEYIYIQLTEQLSDTQENFETVMRAREQAKIHFGYECFYQESLAYDQKEHPEKAGTVFKVPEFVLCDDENGLKVEILGL